MKLLIGTQNKAKQQDMIDCVHRTIEEIESTANLPELELLLPQDIGITQDVDETGDTFEENSALKARYYFEQAQLPVVADDGGIMIDILGGAPGVHTKRWLGRPVSDEAIVAHTLQQLKPYPKNVDRAAIFRTCVTFFDGKNLVQKTADISGHIAEKPKSGRPLAGFPFRTIFKLPNGKYYDDLTAQEHSVVNHRQLAIRDLFDTIFPRDVSHS